MPHTLHGMEGCLSDRAPLSFAAIELALHHHSLAVPIEHVQRCFLEIGNLKQAQEAEIGHSGS
jgi:hypothetical protein